MARVETYKTVHKGIRAALFEAVAVVGRTEFADEAEAAAAVAAVARRGPRPRARERPRARAGGARALRDALRAHGGMGADARGGGELRRAP